MARKPLREVYILFKRMDDMLYQIGYNVSRTRFSEESARNVLSGKTKIDYFMPSHSTGKLTAPSRVFHFTRNKLLSLESLLKELLGCDEWEMPEKVSGLSEQGKEPLIEAIESSSFRRYLGEAKVSIGVLRDMLVDYQKRGNYGQLNMTAFSDYISDELKKDGVNLSASEIRDAFKPGSEIKRITRKAYYIIKNLKIKPNLFTRRIAVENITGGRTMPEWISEQADKYGFKNVNSFYRALSEETKIPYSTLARGLRNSKTVDYRILRCLQKWEKKQSKLSQLLCLSVSYD